MRRPGIHALGLDGWMPQERFSPEELGDYMTTGAMDSGSYFTDLLHNDVEESQDFAPVVDTSTEHTPAAGKGYQGRTKNFRDEDKLLVSAWLNVSMDPIQGVDQSQQSYWSGIHDYFHDHMTFKSDHTQGSLMKRWSAILHDVNVFCGCVTRIEDRNHSGWSVDDKIAHACALFKAEDRKKKKFALMHCWRILKDKPKWLARRKALGEVKAANNKKPKRTANSSPSSDAPSPTPDNGSVDAAVLEEVSGRPDGKKKEKQKLRQRSTTEALDYLVEKMKEADAEIEMKRDLKRKERCNKAFALQEERNKLEREKFELKRELEEERILSLDLSNMTSKQQQYYEEHQNEILARRAGSRLP